MCWYFVHEQWWAVLNHAIVWPHSTIQDEMSIPRLAETTPDNLNRRLDPLQNTAQADLGMRKLWNNNFIFAGDACYQWVNGENSVINCSEISRGARKKEWTILSNNCAVKYVEGIHQENVSLSYSVRSRGIKSQGTKMSIVKSVIFLNWNGIFMSMAG